MQSNKNSKLWSEEQWGLSELGDRRRTLRAVQLGASMADAPDKSLPQQTGSWGDLKGAYRLLQEKDVTHEKLQCCHWASTQAAARQCLQQGEAILLVQDTTLLDYSSHQQTSGLGPIGDEYGLGLVVHSCLAVSGEDTEDKSSLPLILGMAHQQVWARLPKEQRSLEGKVESDKWIQAVQRWDRPEQGYLVSVGDRESDVFSYLRQCQEQGMDCLIRVCQNRVTTVVEGEEQVHLKDWARTLEPMATRQIHLRARGGCSARDVILSIAWHPCTIMPPQNGTDRGKGITGWCMRCWESSPSEGKSSPLEWILFCTIPVEDAVMARRVLGWYERRWMIEEYHKCLKSGCRIESSQLQDGASLQRLLGFLGLIAVRLLQLRGWARTHPNARASSVIPAMEVRVVAKYLGITDAQLTLRRFYRTIAAWGGFIGRRRDGEPGWQTLWKGWMRLQDMCMALQITQYRP